MVTAPVLVGLDVGGTKILAVAVEQSAQGPVVVQQVKVPSGGTAEHLIGLLGDCVDQAAAGRPLQSIGMGLPAFIGLDGMVRRAPNLASIVGVDIASPLRARFGVPLAIDNDANCVGWAARVFDAPAASSLLAITLGTGIGGGVMLGPGLWRGFNGFAGEPGHMIVDAEGPLCACGQHGCWEMWASGNGLGRIARAAAAAGTAPELLGAAGGRADAIEGPMVTKAAAAGSSEAQAILDRYGWWVAVGLASLVNILDPETVVLGGGIVAEGELVLAPIRRQLATFELAGRSATLDLRISSLGPTAGAIGAALLGGEAARTGGS